MNIIEKIGFVHLHTHTAFSLLNSSITIDTLLEAAVKDQQPTLAITDKNNLYASFEFAEEALARGIKPIIGLELSVGFARPDGEHAEHDAYEVFPVVLLVRNETGYQNLLRLTQKIYFDGLELHGTPYLPIQALDGCTEGLFMLTGGRNGPIDQALSQNHNTLARKRLEALCRFTNGNVIVEWQRESAQIHYPYEIDLLLLAQQAFVPVCASHNVNYLTPEDCESYDVLLAISQNTFIEDSKRVKATLGQDFKSRRAMLELFKDKPEACYNSVRIAMACNYWPTKRSPILPAFLTREEQSEDDLCEDSSLLIKNRDNVSKEARLLISKAQKGLDERLKTYGLAKGKVRSDYSKRLTDELNVIITMDFPGYFLIVSDFILWAKSQDIPVGPGRGSGAGSLVAYCLYITDLDPLKFGLLFERFLNPERVSMPDFDIDFCIYGRERVIEYVKKRYGADYVALILTFGSLLAKNAIKDVGRALSMPYYLVDQFTKLIPHNPAKPITIDQAITEEPRLQNAINEDTEVAHLFSVARRLEGIPRHVSTHAAGVVIADRPIAEIVPVQKEPRTSMPVTQFTMKWIEKAGLVKFDFLGLKTLTIIQDCLTLLKKRSINLNLSNLALDDPATYALLRSGNTTGIFQVESAGMRRALCEMQADRFEDIIAIVALYRPGPMANIPLYCERKLGSRDSSRAEWYMHPSLEPILKETFGIIIYQEQVIEIARILAGYSLGEADLLRRAMGKKIKSEMDAQRHRFVEGAKANGLRREEATTIFNLLARFADYGFNKSHAAAYALLTYQTAYLKTNYPVEFYAAIMNNDMDNIEKLSEFYSDALKNHVKIMSPNLNSSGAFFDVDHDKVVYPFSAIKGVGRSVALQIVERRGEKPFTGLDDFVERVADTAINKKTLESLIYSGVFDCLNLTRSELAANVESLIKHFGRHKNNENKNVLTLFQESHFESTLLSAEPFRQWNDEERLSKEYQTLGFFISGHPLDSRIDVLKKVHLYQWSELALEKLKQGSKLQLKIACVVLDRKEKRTKTGGKIGIVDLSDQFLRFEALLFSDTLDTYRDCLSPGRCVLLDVKVSQEDEETKLRIESVQDLDTYVLNKLKGVRVAVNSLQGISKLASACALNGNHELSVRLTVQNQAVDILATERLMLSFHFIEQLKRCEEILNLEVY